MISRDLLEEAIGTRINNIALFEQAFTHKSYSSENYETLEFVGDSVLGFIVTKHIYEKWTGSDPGFLTRARTKIVRGSSLATIAKRIGLHNLIRMDQKGMTNRWFENDKILEDVFEALIGAIYLDSGMVAAKAFVLSCLSDHYDWGSIMDDDNYKDQLMRYCQTFHELPSYETIQDQTSKMFITRAVVKTHRYKPAVKRTKKESEQAAAHNALKAIKPKNINASRGPGLAGQGVRSTKVSRMASATKHYANGERRPHSNRTEQVFNTN